MANGTVTGKGIVHGRTIELQQESGLPEGQEVTVTMQPMSGMSHLPLGEGLRRSAGGWADDADGLEAFLQWNRLQRKQGRREPRG